MFLPCILLSVLQFHHSAVWFRLTSPVGPILFLDCFTILLVFKKFNSTDWSLYSSGKLSVREITSYHQTEWIISLQTVRYIKRACLLRQEVFASKLGMVLSWVKKQQVGHPVKGNKDVVRAVFHCQKFTQFFLLKNNICPSGSLCKRDVQWAKNNFLGPKDECPRFRQLLRQQGWRRRPLRQQHPHGWRKQLWKQWWWTATTSTMKTTMMTTTTTTATTTATTTTATTMTTTAVRASLMIRNANVDPENIFTLIIVNDKWVLFSSLTQRRGKKKGILMDEKNVEERIAKKSIRCLLMGNKKS